MKKLLALSFVALVAGSGVATSTAEAHFLWHHKHLKLERKVSYFKRSIVHDKTAITWLKRARLELRGHVRELSDAAHAARIARELRWHREALSWHQSLLRQYQEKWRVRHPPRPQFAPSALPPHYSAWQCIHRYEGSWTDGGSPYWGGLQMDMSFQSSYGGQLLRSKGTADNWTPLEQMWVAERAYQSGRGFYPWPNTARNCGLL